MKWLILFLWLILGLIYYNFHSSYTAECCTYEDVTPATSRDDGESSQAIALEREPLLMQYNTSKAITSERFDAYKEMVLQSMPEGDKLIITGYYSLDEDPPSNYDNLGLARAAAIRDLFVRDSAIAMERIIIRGEVQEDVIDSANLFKGYMFMTTPDEGNKNVVKLEKRTLIYFEYGADQPITDTKVMNYLDEVAEQVIQSGQKIWLTGHTDSYSGSRFNYTLGLRRAQKIGDYLVSKGVPKDQLVIRSKGEKAPIAPNTTQAGRSKNRRVELEIK